MNNIAEADSGTTVVEYSPTHVVQERSGIRPAASGYTAYKRSTYMNADALFQYWVSEDQDADEDAVDYAVESQPQISHAEELAKLVLGKYDQRDYVTNYPEREIELSYTHFRDSATFLSGGITDGYVPSIVEWLKHHNGYPAVILDAERYSDKSESPTRDEFTAFMEIANNQPRLIKQGIIDLFPESAKDAIAFIDAAPGADITNCPHGDTKWMAEGRILSWELVKLKSFQKNFDLLVIKNASKFIHSDRLNLNNIYRLMAKLGRVNTKIVFVG